MICKPFFSEFIQFSPLSHNYEIFESIVDRRIPKGFEDSLTHLLAHPKWATYCIGYIRSVGKFKTRPGLVNKGLKSLSPGLKINNDYFTVKMDASFSASRAPKMNQYICRADFISLFDRIRNKQ